MQRQIINSTLIYFSMIVLQALIQIILLPFQTHYLTPDQFGVLATVIAFSTLLAPIFNFGLQGAAQRFSSDFNNDTEKLAILWTTLLCLGAITGIIVGALLYLLTMMVSSQSIPFSINFITLTTVIAHAIGMGLVLMFSELLRMIHQPYRYAVAITFMSVSYCLFNILFVGILGMSLNGALLAFGIMPMIGCITFILTNKNKIRWSFNTKLIKDILTYSIKVLPYFSFTTLNTIADRLLIVFILGQYYAGIYTVGTTTASAMLMLVNAISFSVRPHIFAKFNESTTTALQSVRQLSLISMIIIALAGANLSVWAPEIINLLTTNAYHDAWQITILLTIKFMLQGISLFIVCNILFNKKKVHGLIWISVCNLLLLIALSIQLAPRFGIWSVAIAGLVASLCELILNTLVSKKTFSMTWPIFQMFFLIIAYMVPAIGLLALTYSNHWPLSLILLAKGGFTAFTLPLSFFIISKQTKYKFSTILTVIMPGLTVKPSSQP